MTQLFVLMQLLDALTMRPDIELNPLVVWLGPSAYAAKAAMVVFVIAVSVLCARTRHSDAGRLVLAVGAIAGLVGYVSNL